MLFRSFLTPFPHSTNNKVILRSLCQITHQKNLRIFCFLILHPLPKHTQPQTPPVTTFSPYPIATGTLPCNPVLEQIIPDNPISQPPTSQPSTSKTTTSEPITSASITSEPPISFYGSPIITLPSESTDLILYNPLPHNLLDCIRIFGYNASRQVSEMMASSSVNPVDVRKNWEIFQ